MTERAASALLAVLFSALLAVLWWLFVPRRRASATALAKAEASQQAHAAAKRRVRGKLDV